MYDIHCHLDLDPLADQLVEILRPGKLQGVLSCGIHPDSWRNNLAFAEQYPINLGLGLHPFFVVSDYGEGVERLQEAATASSVIAIGEIGLDYSEAYVGSREIQLQALEIQLKLAAQTNLPVIIHCRQAYEDLWPFLDRFELNRIIFHAFSGTEQDLARGLERGALFSFGHLIANPTNKKQKRLLKKTPVVNLLLETDAPFPWRQNGEDRMLTPQDIPMIYQAAADLKNLSVLELDEKIKENVKDVWKDFKELSN